jgi:hypothetical protein
MLFTSDVGSTATANDHPVFDEILDPMVQGMAVGVVIRGTLFCDGLLHVSFKSKCLETFLEELKARIHEGLRDVERGGKIGHQTLSAVHQFDAVGNHESGRKSIHGEPVGLPFLSIALLIRQELLTPDMEEDVSEFMRQFDALLPTWKSVVNDDGIQVAAEVEVCARLG